MNLKKDIGRGEPNCSLATDATPRQMSHHFIVTFTAAVDVQIDFLMECTMQTAGFFVPNSVMDGDGFYVSYNAHDIGVYGCDTTALVVGQMEKFYILKGDHRAQYAPLIDQGFDACASYFKDHIGDAHKCSDKLDDAHTSTCQTNEDDDIKPPSLGM